LVPAGKRDLTTTSKKDDKKDEKSPAAKSDKPKSR